MTWIVPLRGSGRLVIASFTSNFKQLHLSFLSKQGPVVGQAGLRQVQRMTGEGATVTQAARILKISRSAALSASPRPEAVDICSLHV